MYYNIYMVKRTYKKRTYKRNSNKHNITKRKLLKKGGDGPIEYTKEDIEKNINDYIKQTKSTTNVDDPMHYLDKLIPFMEKKPVEPDDDTKKITYLKLLIGKFLYINDIPKNMSNGVKYFIAKSDYEQHKKISNYTIEYNPTYDSENIEDIKKVFNEKLRHKEEEIKKRKEKYIEYIKNHIEFKDIINDPNFNYNDNDKNEIITKILDYHAKNNYVQKKELNNGKIEYKYRHTQMPKGTYYYNGNDISQYNISQYKDIPVWDEEKRRYDNMNNYDGIIKKYKYIETNFSEMFKFENASENFQNYRDFFDKETYELLFKAVYLQKKKKFESIESAITEEKVVSIELASYILQTCLYFLSHGYKENGVSDNDKEKKTPKYNKNKFLNDIVKDILKFFFTPEEISFEKYILASVVGKIDDKYKEPNEKEPNPEDKKSEMENLFKGISSGIFNIRNNSKLKYYVNSILYSNKHFKKDIDLMKECMTYENFQILLGKKEEKDANNDEYNKHAIDYNGWFNVIINKYKDKDKEKRTTTQSTPSQSRSSQSRPAQSNKEWSSGKDWLKMASSGHARAINANRR